MIFTNQGGVADGKQKLSDLTGKILDMIKDAGVPVLALMATAKDHCRKPSTGMWEALCDMRGKGALSVRDSFFIGDAAGAARARAEPAWRTAGRRSAQGAPAITRALIASSRTTWDCPFSRPVRCGRKGADAWR